MAQPKEWRMSSLASGQSDRWIRQQYNTAIKAANDRIKTLSQAKYIDRAQAYKYYVKGDLADAPYTKERGGMTVFKALPAGADRGLMMEGLRMVERFLGAKTSTVRGLTQLARERREKLNDVLKDDFKKRGGSGKTPRLTKAECDDVLEWMGSEEGKTAKKDFDSAQTREAISKAVIANRGSGKSVSDLYSDFKDSQKTMADWLLQAENKLGYKPIGQTT